MLTQSNRWLAAQELASIQMKYAKSGRTLNQAALCGTKEFIEWQHYPNNDLIDENTGYEFYYHAHSADEMSKGEHGHFHVIKRNTVCKWIGALMQLFQPEIEALLFERDRQIARLTSKQGSREYVLNSRKYHVLSECKIDLIERLSENLLSLNS